MTPAQAGRPMQPNAEAWSKISRTWGAAGGESLAALSKSLRKSSKANPNGLLDPNDPVRNDAG